MAWLPCWCRLPLECHCRQRRRSHGRRTWTKGTSRQYMSVLSAELDVILSPSKMTILEFPNPDTTASIYIFLPTGLTDRNTTTTIYPMMSVSTIACANMVRFEFWLARLKHWLASKALMTCYRSTYHICLFEILSLCSQRPLTRMMHQAVTTSRYVIVLQPSSMPTKAILEYPIHKLANAAIQTPSSQLPHRLARWIPYHGGPNDRFRKRRFRRICRTSLSCYSKLQSQLLYTNIKGQSTLQKTMQNIYWHIQVDENMGRAQQRDAALSEKFYFRKDVYPLVHSSAASVASSSGTSSPNGAPRIKEKKMRNCFPPLPLPANGSNRVPVEDEYEEMTMNEIINGKVSPSCTCWSGSLIDLYFHPTGCFFPWPPRSSDRLSGYTGCGARGID